MSKPDNAKYFDLHLTGVGYLNRIRLVTPKEGEPFLSVTLAALRGSVDNVLYTRRTWVSGERGASIVPESKARRRVIASPIARSRNAAIGCERRASRPEIRVRRVYLHLECRVSGSEAQHIVRQLRPAVEDKLRVLVGFRASDLFAERFTHKNGSKAGQIGVSLKARLLRISWAKVEGQPFLIEQAA